uniref:Aspartyl/asparaginy/proline hydroxylase domain-containing protein n=1 Tax=Phaeomonas parva TaxID=124430 RepID=A0A7S1XXE6_9STRA|mmetsp:Transcript_46224/g.144561  ORF Transcript_46224/g.144561 Transcript_46224/m.144561 type:complete len:611 (+) Transcript_46224:88-1920(+)
MARLNWRLVLGLALLLLVLLCSAAPAAAAKKKSKNNKKKKGKKQGGPPKRPSTRDRAAAMAAAKKAEQFEEEKNFEQAAREYIKIIKLNALPFQETVFFNLGAAYREGGMYREAYQAFVEAEKIVSREEYEAPQGTSVDDMRRDVHIQIAGVCEATNAWPCVAEHLNKAALAFGAIRFDDEEEDTGKLAWEVQYDWGKALVEVGDAQLAAERLETALTIGNGFGIDEDSRAMLISRMVMAKVMIQGAVEDDEQQHLRQLSERYRAGQAAIEIHLFLGAKLERYDAKLAARHLAVAREALEEEDEPSKHPSASEIFWRLGRAHLKDGAPDAAEEAHAAALEMGLWPSAEQRPGYFWKSGRGAHARPLVTAPIPSSSAGLRFFEGFKPLWEVLRVLERAREQIAAEFMAQAGAATALGGMDFEADEEGVADEGTWQRAFFVKDGVRLENKNWGFGEVEVVADGEAAAAGAGAPFPPFPRTTDVLERVLAKAATDLPTGAVAFSVLGPKTHLAPRTGPGNHRLRILLPIHVPEGAAIRVGGQREEWNAKKALVIDDSFEHEAWNENAAEAAILLSVDVWHPSIPEDERDVIRQHFGFFNETSWEANSPWVESD